MSLKHEPPPSPLSLEVVQNVTREERRTTTKEQLQKE